MGLFATPPSRAMLPTRFDRRSALTLEAMSRASPSVHSERIPAATRPARTGASACACARLRCVSDERRRVMESLDPLGRIRSFLWLRTCDDPHRDASDLLRTSACVFLPTRRRGVLSVCPDHLPRYSAPSMVQTKDRGGDDSLAGGFFAPGPRKWPRSLDRRPPVRARGPETLRVLLQRGK